MAERNSPVPGGVRPPRTGDVPGRSGLMFFALDGRQDLGWRDRKARVWPGSNNTAPISRRRHLTQVHERGAAPNARGGPAPCRRRGRRGICGISCMWSSRPLTVPRYTPGAPAAGSCLLVCAMLAAATRACLRASPGPAGGGERPCLFGLGPVVRVRGRNLDHRCLAGCVVAYDPIRMRPLQNGAPIRRARRPPGAWPLCGRVPFRSSRLLS